MEFHPRINPSDPKLEQSRIILGSFPTWQFTGTKCKNEELEKDLLIKKRGEISFYYGSQRNQFWVWYQKYLDQLIFPNDLASIKLSLTSNSIGITDVIYSCKRHGRSALDKHLSSKTYNHNFFNIPEKGEVVKILCTSKGVMNEMLLVNSFYNSFPELKSNEITSDKFQEKLLKKIGGNSLEIRSPFYRELEFENGGKIQVISTPSPGSPYRRLIDFGSDGQDPKKYLDNYLRELFSWFNESL